MNLRRSRWCRWGDRGGGSSGGVGVMSTFCAMCIRFPSRPLSFYFFFFLDNSLSFFFSFAGFIIYLLRVDGLCTIGLGGLGI